MKIDQTCIGVGLLAVDLSQNNLGGPVPPELQSLTSLALFNGRNNMMSGNVPAWLGTLSRLQVSEQEEIWAKLTTILTLLSIVYALQCLLIPCKVLIWAWAVLACSIWINVPGHACNVHCGWLTNMELSKGAYFNAHVPSPIQSSKMCSRWAHQIHKLFWDQTRSSSYQSSIIQTVISSFRIGVDQSQLHKSSQMYWALSPTSL